eukprot:1505940-Prymnesium_polylepis.1
MAAAPTTTAAHSAAAPTSPVFSLTLSHGALRARVGHGGGATAVRLGVSRVEMLAGVELGSSHTE